MTVHTKSYAASKAERDIQQTLELIYAAFLTSSYFMLAFCIPILVFLVPAIAFISLTIAAVTRLKRGSVHNGQEYEWSKKSRFTIYATEYGTRLRKYGYFLAERHTWLDGDMISEFAVELRFTNCATKVFTDCILDILIMLPQFNADKIQETIVFTGADIIKVFHGLNKCKGVNGCGASVRVNYYTKTIKEIVNGKTTKKELKINTVDYNLLALDDNPIIYTTESMGFYLKGIELMVHRMFRMGVL